MCGCPRPRPGPNSSLLWVSRSAPEVTFRRPLSGCNSKVYAPGALSGRGEQRRRRKREEGEWGQGGPHRGSRWRGWRAGSERVPPWPAVSPAPASFLSCHFPSSCSSGARDPGAPPVTRHRELVAGVPTAVNQTSPFLLPSAPSVLRMDPASRRLLRNAVANFTIADGARRAAFVPTPLPARAPARGPRGPRHRGFAPKARPQST